MPRFIYRTHKDNTLTIPGHSKTYRDGDPITLLKVEALRLATQSRLHRFEEVADPPVAVSADTTPAPAATKPSTT